MSAANARRRVREFRDAHISCTSSCMRRERRAPGPRRVARPIPAAFLREGENDADVLTVRQEGGHRARGAPRAHDIHTEVPTTVASRLPVKLKLKKLSRQFQRSRASEGEAESDWIAPVPDALAPPSSPAVQCPVRSILVRIAAGVPVPCPWALLPLLG